MARYVNILPLQAPPEALFNAIHAYLTSEGYEYRQYKNENVFKKGMGLMAGPSFIKVSFSQNTVMVEAWMKFALLPGVYMGEMDLTGFTGAAVKGPLKKRVAQVEAMILQYAGAPMAGAPVDPTGQA